MKTKLSIALTVLLPASLAISQVLNTTPSKPQGDGIKAPQSNNSSSQKKDDSLAGGIIPMVDTYDSDQVVFDGKTWNLTDNRLFQAKFENYLNNEGATSEEDQAYFTILKEIRDAVSPNRPGGPSLNRSVALLPSAAEFELDARICESVANAVYGVWLGQKSVAEKQRTLEAMKRERREISRNAKVAAEPTLTEATPPGGGGRNGNGRAQSMTEEQMAVQIGDVAIYIKEITELEAEAAVIKGEAAVSELQAKAEYQTLIIQLLAQRRFEHVIIACRIYRAIFRDGDGMLKLEEGSDVHEMFVTSLGVNPTINTLDAFANEMVRDVTQAVKAFHLLTDRGEYESASKRLSEAYMIGEYLPMVQTIPLEKKRKVLGFVRDANMLRNTLAVKDFGEAEIILARMRENATDFDYSKPHAAIQASKLASNMHLDKASVAMHSGDGETFSAEALKAAQIWPTNPRLNELSKVASDQGDAKSQALITLNNLIAQKNYRQIVEDLGRYSAAVAGEPELAAKLKEITTHVSTIDIVLRSADKMAGKGDDAGAWEAVRRAADEFPEDTQINMSLAKLTTRVPNFVQALEKAKQLEESNQHGSSLAWYLKARGMYPMSEFADEGIDRVVDEMRPNKPAATFTPTSTSQDPAGSIFAPPAETTQTNNNNDAVNALNDF